MLTVSSLTVQSYDFQSLTLSWEFETTSENLADYYLDIYRSETPEPTSDFSIVGSGVSTTAYSYTDTTISGYNLRQHHTWYYRLKVVEAAMPTNTSWSDPGHFSYAPDPQAKRMLHVKGVGIKKYGRFVKILKQRHGATETATATCPDCWDSMLGRLTDDNCTTCYNTGITSGYYDPIDVYAAVNYRPKQNQITPFGLWQQNDALMDFLNYPVIEPDDLIVDPLNKRWKVKQVITYDKGLTLISQRCHVSLQEKENPVYQVEVE